MSQTPLPYPTYVHEGIECWLVPKTDMNPAAYRQVVEAGREALDWLLPADPGSSRYEAWDQLKRALAHIGDGGPHESRDLLAVILLWVTVLRKIGWMDTALEDYSQVRRELLELEQRLTSLTTELEPLRPLSRQFTDLRLEVVDAMTPCHNPKHDHRCWPSRVGWGLVAFLTAYLLWMHSEHFAEDARRLQVWHTAWVQEWKMDQETFLASLQPPKEHTRYGQRWQRRGTPPPP